MKIRAKLTLVGIVASAVPLALVAAFALNQLGNAEAIAADEVMHLVVEENELIVSGVISMVTSQQEVLEAKVQSDLAVARDQLARYGSVTLGDELVSWNAINQFTQDRIAVELPQMLAGEQWLGQIRRPATFAPVVDDAKALVGGTATVFQRMNEAGDMLRVSTNVETLDGLRAVGTFIPAQNPDGSANAVIAAVLRGETFVGRAFVVNRWYVTAYEPIRDSAGSVIGVLYAGVPEESATSLRRQIIETRVGASGYVFVLDSSGRYVISRDGERDGEILLDATDADGRPFVRDMIAEAQTLAHGEYGTIQYPWRNADDATARMKTVSFGYFEPWDWIVASGTYDEEFLAGLHAMEAQNDRGRMIVFAVIALSAIAAVVTWLAMASRIARPVVRGVEFARRIARGELGIDLDIRQADEIGELADSLREMLAALQYKADVLARVSRGDLTVDVELASADDGLGESLTTMVDSLDHILHQVRDAADQVGSGADQIAASSQSLSQGATESASSLEEITASVNEINGQIAQNSESVAEATKLSGQAAEDARRGQEEMGRLREAMSSISASAETTRKVVKTIDDIAFQINLLALNANVEAARAGKYGKGFAVVAEEVRNLAVRSAEAVKETTQMVDQSVAAIARGEEGTASTADQLESIVAGAARVADVLEEVAAASREQALGVEQIGQGLEQVDSVTQANTAEAEESAAASEELSGQAMELNRIVATFKLKGTSEPSIGHRGNGHDAIDAPAPSGNGSGNQVGTWGAGERTEVRG